MKKSVFLLFAWTAIALCSCASSTDFQRRATFHRHPMVNTNHPASLHLDNDRGIRLSLSPRSAVKIDVEGILAVVHGDGDEVATIVTDTVLHPWLRFDFTY